MGSLLFTCNQVAQTRRETVGGIEYLIAPTVAIKAGVLNGELVTAEEIGTHFHSWDGRPFVVGHPPQVDGEDVSANDPALLAAMQLGWLFNTHFDDGALKGEIWVDVSRAEIVDGGAEVVDRLENGKLEISTAYFRDRDEKPGTLDGVEYDAVAHNLRPDHLAALLDAKGACSWADGCGAPRVNQDAEPGGPDTCVCPECGYETDKERGTPCRAMTCPECGAKLTAGDDMETEPEKPEKPEKEITPEAANESRVLCALRTIASAFGIEFNQNTENTEASKMEELIKAILEDGRLGLNEEQLTALDEDVVKALLAALRAMPKAEAEEEPEANGDDEQEIEAETAPEANEALPPEMAALTEAFAKRGGVEQVLALLDGLQANQAGRKAELITALASNAACAFSQERLEQMNVDDLETLQHSLSPADYSGRGGGPVSNTGESNPLVMPDIFAQEVA